MMRRLPLVVTLALTLAVLHASRALAQAPATYRDAAHAWDRGEYVVALDQFARLLRGPESSRWHDSIALVTGELYRTVELASDGMRPAFSHDGRFVLYETGNAGARVTRVVSSGISGPGVLEVPGGSGSMSRSSTLIASIIPPQAGQGQVLIRDMASGRDMSVTGLEGWAPTELAFGIDDSTLFVVASRAMDTDRNHILRLARTATGFVSRGTIIDAPGFKSAPVDVEGRWIVHAVTSGNPVRMPTGSAGLRAAKRFAIVDMRAGTTRLVEGASPAVAARAPIVAWIGRDSGATTIMSMSLRDRQPVRAILTRDSISSVAVSPSGTQLAYQYMPREDWEIAVVARDGTADRRLSREIQHDIVIQWVDDTTILSVMGEARHRRSYLLDARSGRRVRLFHNNSVRTIAPEYEWVASADGSMVLVIAQRDGNTSRLQRAVHLTTLREKVTRDVLLSRVDSNRAAERVRLARNAEMFRPIAAAVRRATDAVDVTRIFAHERALFDFDSKHVTKPGNALAIAYLTDAFRAAGYEPTLQSFATGSAPSSNVLAVLRGTVSPDVVYVVSSHFDSRAEGPGADDNTSGTAALLEAARVLAGHPQPATIIFASFTAEESGLLGSMHFARTAERDSMRIVGALNNDMLGWANDARLDNTIRYSSPGIRDVQHAAAQQFSAMITYDAVYVQRTDAESFLRFGTITGGIGSYPVLGNPHYHQPHDVLETINHQLVAEASRTTVASIMLLASSPSPVRGLTLSADASGGTLVAWTPAPERDIARYVVTWGPAAQPESNRRTVGAAVARLIVPGLQPGWVVQVRAVNAKGLPGWDWARATVRDR